MGKAKRIRKARMKNKLHRKVWRKIARNQKFCQIYRAAEVSRRGEDHFLVKYFDSQIAIHSPRKVSQLHLKQVAADGAKCFICGRPCGGGAICDQCVFEPY